MVRAYFPAAALLSLLSVVGATGCGGKERAAVSGAVSFDGAPVDNGNITFVPVDGPANQSVGESIKNGKYAIAADHGPSPGKYQVQITWDRVTGGKTTDPDLKSNDTKQVLPDKFNKATTLAADIKAGDNTVDFPLSSK